MLGLELYAAIPSFCLFLEFYKCFFPFASVLPSSLFKEPRMISSLCKPSPSACLTPFFLDPKSHSAAQSTLELTVPLRLMSNSQVSSCLGSLSARNDKPY